MTADTRNAAWPKDATPGSLVVSASRLKNVGGEKGDPGCERRYAGAYLFDMKQAASGATDLGSAVHSVAEHYQATGEVPFPEDPAAVVFAAGAHLVNYTGKLLVEHEHVGLLPDGTPFTARMDGHSPDGGNTACVVVVSDGDPEPPPEAASGAVVCQDLKTTGSGTRFALEAGEGTKGLRRDLQAMLYAWVLLCLPHWFSPMLPPGVVGPRHWQWWDPTERRCRAVRLRWLYFATEGTPRAWEATDWVTPAQAESFLASTIMPLVHRMVAVHQVVARGLAHNVNEFDRNIEATCRWCGVNERQACEYGTLGTPAEELIQLKRRPQMTPQERLAALKAGNAARTAAAAPAPAPAPEAAPASPPPAAQPAADPSPEVSASGTAANAEPVSEAAAPSAPARGRGRPRTRPPATPPGAGINPPEVVEALAKLQPEGPSGIIEINNAPALLDGKPVGATLQLKADAISLTQAVGLLSQLLPVGTSMTVHGTKS